MGGEREVPGEGHNPTSPYLPQIPKKRRFSVNCMEHKKCGQNLKFHTAKLGTTYGKVRKVSSVTNIFVY
jgi:hypothetical protein